MTKCDNKIWSFYLNLVLLSQMPQLFRHQAFRKRPIWNSFAQLFLVEDADVILFVVANFPRFVSSNQNSVFDGHLRLFIATVHN